ncbi:MAG: DAK2 domain-containing protein [Tissierellia bacterium]|nr:DAK2 domain-containing protein [Tissierellia bacterium]
MNIERIDIDLLKQLLVGAANNLVNNQEEVNELNVFPVPDGDTGTNMSLTIKSAIKLMEETESNSVTDVVKAFSKGSLMGARGNSGVILSQLFRGFADSLDAGKEYINIDDIAKGLNSSVVTAYNAVMKPTEGTILTVAKDIANYSKKIYKREKDIKSFIGKLIEEGNKSLDRTPDLLPVLKQAGVVDAGGKGLLCIIEGVYKVLDGDTSILSSNGARETVKKVAPKREHIDTDDIEFGYCTEFIIQSDEAGVSKSNQLREELSEIGDSIMVVGVDDIIKVHFHTNNPGVGIEKALKLGFLKDIKIDNMRLQHEEVLFSEEEYSHNHDHDHNHFEEVEEPTEKKDFAFISVSAGEGFTEVFKSLHVSHIITGGQTMNPSTEDIIHGIEKCNSDNIFILPNNSNIILAAEQAKSISDKNIFIIPTKTIPEGITALLSYSESLSPEENYEVMLESIQGIKSGEVTFAVRDTEFNSTVITKGDIIGITGKDIVAKGKDPIEVTEALIEKMYDDEMSMISLYYGEDTSVEDAEKLEEIISEKYDDLDVELIYGGQPLYYYIVSLE